MQDVAKRGDAIYERRVKPTLRPEDHGKYVAIDVQSQEFEIADDEVAAWDNLHARQPEAQVWMVRAGLGYLHRFGLRRRAMG